MKKLTKRQAVLGTIQVWQWLKDNPEVTKKTEAPAKYRVFEGHDLKKQANYCFLCTVGYHKGGPSSDDTIERKCICPLGVDCSTSSPYGQWTIAGTSEKRSRAAQHIVDICTSYARDKGWME